MNRFKPGDKARIIGNRNEHGYKIDDVVTLELHLNYHTEVYLCERNGLRWHVFAEDLQPITESIRINRGADANKHTERAALTKKFHEEREPIEPVQEEESQKFFPLEFRLNNIGLLVGSVDIEYVVKYDQALQLAESTISRLKSEIKELKRKA